MPVTRSQDSARRTRRSTRQSPGAITTPSNTTTTDNSRTTRTTRSTTPTPAPTITPSRKRKTIASTKKQQQKPQQEVEEQEPPLPSPIPTFRLEPPSPSPEPEPEPELRSGRIGMERASGGDAIVRNERGNSAGKITFSTSSTMVGEGRGVEDEGAGEALVLEGKLTTQSQDGYGAEMKGKEGGGKEDMQLLAAVVGVGTLIVGVGYLLLFWVMGMEGRWGYDVGFLRGAGWKGEEGGSWVRVVGMGVWRMFEIAISWYSGFDSYDVAALSVLAHGPTLYLLHEFYTFSSEPLLASLALEVLAVFAVFRFFRPASQRPSTANPVVIDIHLLALTTILPAGIYGLVLFVSLSTYLPSTLIGNFRVLPTSSSLPIAASPWSLPLLPATIMCGLAARMLIFAPAASVSVTGGHAGGKSGPMEWSAPAVEAVKRAGLAAGVVGGRTVVQLVYGLVVTASARYAVEYAAVWVVAVGFTGVGFAGIVR